MREVITSADLQIKDVEAVSIIGMALLVFLQVKEPLYTVALAVFVLEETDN